MSEVGVQLGLMVDVFCLFAKRLGIHDVGKIGTVMEFQADFLTSKPSILSQSRWKVIVATTTITLKADVLSIHTEQT